MKRALLAFAFICALCAPASAQECKVADPQRIIQALTEQRVPFVTGAQAIQLIDDLSMELGTPLSLRPHIAAYKDGYLMFVLPEGQTCIVQITERVKPFFERWFARRSI